MLAGWLRIKYPSVVDGAIAASAPIWQLAGTVARETLDMQAVAMTRGVSAAGGATDRCRHTRRALSLTLTRTLPLTLTRCRHTLRCRTLTLTLTPLTLALPRCRDNLRVAWPLLREAGRSAALGLDLPYISLYLPCISLGGPLRRGARDAWWRGQGVRAARWRGGTEPLPVP